VWNVPEKQARERGSRIDERLAPNDQSARQISHTSSIRLRDSLRQFRNRRGTSWSNNFLRLALTSVPVALPIAMSKDASPCSIQAGSS